MKVCSACKEKYLSGMHLKILLKKAFYCMCWLDRLGVKSFKRGRLSALWNFYLLSFEIHIKFHGRLKRYHFAVCKYLHWFQRYLRTFARKFSNIEFFSKNFTVERWWVSDVRSVKKRGVTDFVLERACPKGHLNPSKSGCVSEEGHSGCKWQNILIRALKGNVLCQIWFKWTY